MVLETIVLPITPIQRVSKGGIEPLKPRIQVAYPDLLHLIKCSTASSGMPDTGLEPVEPCF